MLTSGDLCKPAPSAPGVKAPAGLPQPLPVPGRPWSHIALDFLTGLSPSNGNSVILTIVDRFSKAAYFVALTKLPTARETADLITFHRVGPGSTIHFPGRMEPLRENISHTLFILDGFNELGALRPVLFIPFFIMFIVSLSANSLLLYVIISQRSLHSPMYILIAGMACVDLSLPLFFVPNMLLSFLFDWRGISLIGCLVQMHFIHFVGTFQSTFLLWMALDRYFAICTPLHYHKRMALPKFLKFIILLVFRNILMITLLVSLAGSLSFCSANVINHCFCEHMALVELACGSTSVNNLAGLLTVFLVPVADFIFIAASYVVIFSSVLTSGKSGVKALHTCITHIVVITVSLTIALIAFLSYRIRNGLWSSAAFRVFISTMYLLFPSCFNPIIYGIRTTEIRQHVVKTLMSCRTVDPVKGQLETNGPFPPVPTRLDSDFGICTRFHYVLVPGTRQNKGKAVLHGSEIFLLCTGYSCILFPPYLKMALYQAMANYLKKG
ncbi:hypothetical protein L3Q82_004871 [Scortum barcoo]|uniref:Uncharacterized protein n=1 Tax=Scortum barcoo TaxID=214431 RepID=A0ACB8VEG5_9TELE|nr:hypothetical protein L3Q82_004871 [Scortum barcoo]